MFLATICTESILNELKMILFQCVVLALVTLYIAPWTWFIFLLESNNMASSRVIFISSHLTNDTMTSYWVRSFCLQLYIHYPLITVKRIRWFNLPMVKVFIIHFIISQWQRIIDLLFRFTFSCHHCLTFSCWMVLIGSRTYLKGILLAAQGLHNEVCLIVRSLIETNCMKLASLSNPSGNLCLIVCNLKTSHCKLTLFTLSASKLFNV